MKQSKIQHYTRTITVLLLKLIRVLLILAFWFFAVGMGITAISESGLIRGGIAGILISVVCIFAGGIISVGSEKLIGLINHHNDKKIDISEIKSTADIPEMTKPENAPAVDEKIEFVLKREEKPKPYADENGNACFPEGITKISNYSFERNTKLKYAVLPDTVERIGNRAFADCVNLEKLILNDNLKIIDANAFTGCTSLKNIDFPDSVQEIHGFAFLGTSFTEPVISRSGKVFFRCSVVPGRKTYTVPAGIKEIQDGAFLYHEELEEVILPEGLEKIHMRAFCKTGIKKITIPASVREISKSAFMSCTKLEEVTILCDIKNLPSGVFNGCFVYGSSKYLKITTPGQTIKFDEMLKLQGKSIAEIPSVIYLPRKDFWLDGEFVQLTKKCAVGDVSAMLELGNYYKKYDDKFCQLASNYWYYTAFLYGSKEAKLWYDKWFSENPEKRIPMPMVPHKIGNLNTLGHNSSGINGALARALGYEFFDDERTYDIYGTFDSGLIQIYSWCNTEGPDEDGFGMAEEYDWWILDEFFNMIPGVRMLHSYSFHERNYACTETFDEQYECAKKTIESRKAL